MKKKTLSVIYHNDNLKVKWKTKYNEWIKINFKKNNHLIHKGWFYMPDLNESLLANKDSNIKNKKYKLFKQRFFTVEYDKDNILLKIENKGRSWKEININSKDKQDLISMIEDINKTK
ncbi:hypothetical protein [Spiroplasma endosymbiont of Danaus chrysippus]|uniref:hypothetical protein n=1 Tax=Spiroplasma endosymbiont of Danaus chrysippus TaxID=2691041 RepID=UPI00157AAEA5|nr:hypothetical protein [Spiroplasma endosymbiont of Danaus chrysippus]